MTNETITPVAGLEQALEVGGELEQAFHRGMRAMSFCHATRPEVALGGVARHAILKASSRFRMAWWVLTRRASRRAITARWGGCNLPALAIKLNLVVHVQKC